VSLVSCKMSLGARVCFSYKMSLEGVPACWALTISVQAGERLSLEQMRAFLEGQR
jgi:hypothetical protein